MKVKPVDPDLFMKCYKDACEAADSWPAGRRLTFADNPLKRMIAATKMLCRSKEEHRAVTLRLNAMFLTLPTCGEPYVRRHPNGAFDVHLIYLRACAQAELGDVFDQESLNQAIEFEMRRWSQHVHN